jgi:hypothetical protein
LRRVAAHRTRSGGFKTTRCAAFFAEMNTRRKNNETRHHKPLPSASVGSLR